MKFRARTGIMILTVGVFLFWGGVSATSAEKQVVFRSAYVAAANPHPKIASDLQQAMNFLKLSTKSQKMEYSGLMLKGKPVGFHFDAADRIQCYIQCYDLNRDTLEILRKLGVSTTMLSQKRNIVQSWLSLDQILTLESLPGVKFIRLPHYPVKHVGSVTTEGYSAMGIDRFVNRPEFIGTNVTGKGIKVGVISSAIYLADKSSELGDLPTTETLGNIKNIFGGVTYWSFRTNPFTGQPYGANPTGIITYWAGTTDEEGTAMLEIIHDIVPDARLYFSNFDTDLEMNMSKDWLRGQGCDVITDDIGFYGAGPYDGTSEVSLGSTRQVENGVAYYTSVGNEAEEHWWGYFYDPDANNFQNFSLHDETIEVSVPPDGALSVFLTWDETWGSSGYDIDLYILDPDLLNITFPITFSTNLQSGDGDPEESCGVVNYSSDPQTVSIVITRKTIPNKPYDDANHPMRMNLHILGGTILENNHIVANGSISNNSDAGGGVISVGAIDVTTRLRNLVEYFSSRGPTWDGRLKPEISCFDRTSGGLALWGTNFRTFAGTSCAAPHAAAVAALIKGYKVSVGDTSFLNPWPPKAVVDNINAAIFQGADDMYTAGPDYLSGYGRINAENIFLNFLTPTTRTKRFDFAKSAEEWQFVGIPQYFTVADNSWADGRLILQSKDNNTYGAWESPTIVFSDGMSNLNPSKIYIARFRISTNSDVNTFPGFRLRANGSRHNVGAMRDFNSNSGNEHFPGPGGADYYLIIKPVDTEAKDGIYLSFDLINFDSQKDPKGIMYLDEVEITEYDSP